MDMSLSKLHEMMKDKKAWRAASPWDRKESDMTEWVNNNKKDTELPRKNKDLGRQHTKLKWKSQKKANLDALAS